jgi:hypothetical protein
MPVWAAIGIAYVACVVLGVAPAPTTAPQIDNNWNDWNIPFLAAWGIGVVGGAVTQQQFGWIAVACSAGAGIAAAVVLAVING